MGDSRLNQWRRRLRQETSESSSESSSESAENQGETNQKGTFKVPSSSLDSGSEKENSNRADDEGEDRKNKENEPPQKGHRKEEGEENEPSRGEANKPKPRPTYHDGRVGKHSLKRHFPHRPSFRRMKTWAGERIEQAVIRMEELGQLKSYPSFDRPMRRDNMSPAARATAPAASATSPSPSQKSDQETQTQTQRKKTSTAARAQGSRQDTLVTPARRNPTRAARSRKVSSNVGRRTIKLKSSTICDCQRRK
ncbi:hypothetical protein VTN77DRAFT_3066 [Rasamsonia byssochlamydoides]|uniref:uncharacterized protein n=1 Tax=Rasamsonia byssochlamydoides TaxID=89139 RepID=UPI00374276F1